MYNSYYPDEIWIEKQVSSLSFTQDLVDRLSTIPIVMIDNIGTIIAQNERILDKKILVLANQNGKFLKPCPGTQNYICCNYYFLNLATNCPIGCSYCILQGYLNNPYMTVYTNLDDLFDEMDHFLKSDSKKFTSLSTVKGRHSRHWVI